MIGDILQPTHLLFVLVVALLVLGPKRLPEAGRALGKGIRDFRSAIGGEEDHHSAIPAAAPTVPAPAPPATAAQVPAEPFTAATGQTATTVHEQPVSDYSATEQPSETVHPVG
jgi:sec-independent protein translocase protein TatA